MSRSNSWKDLERYVAKFLNGKRILRGANYSVSFPDVIAPGDILNIPRNTILVECKHSKNQPFIDLIKKYKDTLIIRIEDYLFWDLEQSIEAVDRFKQPLFYLTVDKKKKVPKYIKDNYQQACSYNLLACHELALNFELKNPFRFVVLAKKHINLRVAYTHIQEINKICL